VAGCFFITLLYPRMYGTAGEVLPGCKNEAPPKNDAMHVRRHSRTRRKPAEYVNDPTFRAQDVPVRQRAKPLHVRTPRIEKPGDASVVDAARARAYPLPRHVPRRRTGAAAVRATAMAGQWDRRGRIVPKQCADRVSRFPTVNQFRPARGRFCRRPLACARASGRC
jgi:hypothetical protein